MLQNLASDSTLQLLIQCMLPLSLSLSHTHTHTYTHTCKKPYTCCSYSRSCPIRLVFARRFADPHRLLSECMYRWMFTMVHSIHRFNTSLPTCS